MSFKLLAIRPIKDCDSGILKGLVPNCIYQFYNEYDFYYKQNSETEELQSYIEYQERNLIDKSKKKDLALIYKSIEAIKKTEIRSEEHTSELQSRPHLVCSLLLEKKNNIK